MIYAVEHDSLLSSYLSIRISDESSDGVRGGGGGKMETSISEVNFVRAHFYTFSPLPYPPAVRLSVLSVPRRVHQFHAVQFGSFHSLRIPTGLIDKIICSLPLFIFKAQKLA